MSEKPALTTIWVESSHPDKIENKFKLGGLGGAAATGSGKIVIFAIGIGIIIGW